MENFKCNNCKKTLYIQNYTFKFSPSGDMIYLDKNTKKELLCPDCGKSLEFIKKKQEGPISCNFGTFASLSPLQKQEFLKKRSKEDNKKHKYVDQEREKCFYRD